MLIIRFCYFRKFLPHLQKLMNLMCLQTLKNIWSKIQEKLFLALNSSHIGVPRYESSFIDPHIVISLSLIDIYMYEFPYISSHVGVPTQELSFILIQESPYMCPLINISMWEFPHIRTIIGVIIQEFPFRRTYYIRFPMQKSLDKFSRIRVPIQKSLYKISDI